MKLGLNPTLVLSLTILAGASSAATIDIDSHAGLNSIANPLNGPVSYSTVAIGAYPLWQSNNPTNPGDPDDNSAVWISYAQTGYVGNDFQSYGGQTPVMSVFHNFSSIAGMLTLSVWADDTASVFLDNVEIFYPKFTQGICAGQAIGCLPGDGAQISASLTAGDHTLEFRVFQVGIGINTQTNPFGLLYTGTASAADAFPPDTPPTDPGPGPDPGPDPDPGGGIDPNTPPDPPPTVTPDPGPGDGGIDPNVPPTATPEPGTIALAGFVLLAALPLKNKIRAKRASR